MQPYFYDRPASLTEAHASASPDAWIYAGGTTMLDLMKLGVIRPERIVDITRLPGLDKVALEDGRLVFGALATMAGAAESEAVKAAAPALSESLWLAASQQLREMARLGGNLLQRTRCPYYRDTTYAACNKREPGSGCAALGGVNRLHAVLGTSEACIASYPGDWATTLAAFDAEVAVEGPGGRRLMPFAELHRLPGDTPHIETNLQPGEIITAISVPATPALKRSLYLKARDRESYAFANASAAVGLEMDGDRVKDVRIGLGGVAAKPWRATVAEEALRGRPLTRETAAEAARLAFAGARTQEHNAFKVPLGQRTLVQALMLVKDRG